MEATPSTQWRSQLSDREQKEIAFAEVYAEQFCHGTTGHNALLLIAKLAELIDIAAGVKQPAPPPGDDDLVLTFGKYRDKRLSEVLKLDRGYVEWLAREGRDWEVKAAAQALITPSAELPPEEPASTDGEAETLPF